MKAGKQQDIVIRGAAAHNLAGFDVRIPRRSLTVITGVSGSGKSSLAFDTLFREGQRRFLETLPAFARQFVGGFPRSEVRSIEGLGPAVAVGQRVGLSNPRSTVGTLTEGWDLLRLLFARLGEAPEGISLSRGLFSFNGEAGACPECQGLGVADRLELDLLIADPTRSLRDGALRVSTPNGYLMYSQVTLAVLDEVLRAHGGSVDTPWQDLDESVRQVVLYGSDRLKVPYGKHPLESRLKWTGITARPRQEGFYRGLIPVMEEILRGKRNDSILRFVRSRPCPACRGARLRADALAVTWHGHRIVDLAALTAQGLHGFLSGLVATPAEAPILEPIRVALLERCELMEELGLGYLSLDRPAPSLSRSEVQRLKLLGLALGELRGLLVVLDEPSAGLHPQEIGRLIRVLKRLRDQGQTVVVVEHDAKIVHAADWLIDLGPGPGRAGGQLLWSGPPAELLTRSEQPQTPTQRWLSGLLRAEGRVSRSGQERLRLDGLCRNNLQNLSVELVARGLTVVSGVSGAGKTSLLEEVVERFQAGVEFCAAFQRIVTVDADPIGRTPRSNAATYTGAFDAIRDAYARSSEAKRLGFGKGHFSFNTAGGRCETCEGAGVREIGMRYLGSVELLCEACGGHRFHPEVLAITVKGKNIAELLAGSIDEAAAVFGDHAGLRRILGALQEVGLGYLPLGQPATTLSGGEAQRVKLATELAKAASGPALIVLDEPSTGLHAADVQVLLAAWDRLLAAGHTLLVADNDLDIVRHADFVLDLGPGAGPEGGHLVIGAAPQEVAACQGSHTGAALRGAPIAFARPVRAAEVPPIALRGMRTHTLQNLDISLPGEGLTVITGPSGSGKSSLAFDTLLAEAQNRFADLVSPWARRLLPRHGGADLDSAQGLQASLAVPQRPGRRNPRSTVGTVTELDELARLLFARAGEQLCSRCGEPAWGMRCGCGAGLPTLLAEDFSPHRERGACPSCRGLGFLQRCDPERLVSHPERSLAAGAMAGTRFGVYLGEADGQFLAILRQAAAQQGLDLERSWRELGPMERELAMFGTGATLYDVNWHYRRGRTEGVHRLRTEWVGFAHLVEREYARVHGDPKAEALDALMVDRTCSECGGERLHSHARSTRLGGLRFPELSACSVDAARRWVDSLEASLICDARHVTEDLRRELGGRLQALSEAGLGYLALQREMASLSGGEAQRVRLAAALGGALVGVCYVLDEPSQGLHAWDVARLAALLRRLADAGNAVIVVEHHPVLVGAADHVVELGPGSGPEGGRLVAQGTPAELKAQGTSRTARLLDSARRLGAKQPQRLGQPGITVRGAHCHNLKGIDVAFPLGVLTALTGVSGSGKSSLLMGALAPSLERTLRGEGTVGCKALEMATGFGAVFAADQAPLGHGAASTVLSLIGLGEHLRKCFAATPQAKALKLSPRHFSTAASGGRCEACEGRGVTTIAMDLLPDVTVGCEACQGQRFQPEVLSCRLEGMNITELLERSVVELARHFNADAALVSALVSLEEVGLGYLRLGQEAQALSEGERQRLRLAGILARPSEVRVAILLDEPTRGLGFEDVARLMTALHRLVDAGHLVAAVTHDLDFIAGSDWVIDLGPGAGDAGGRVLVQGAPEAVVACQESLTGRALALRKGFGNTDSPAQGGRS